MKHGRSSRRAAIGCLALLILVAGTLAAGPPAPEDLLDMARSGRHAELSVAVETLSASDPAMAAASERTLYAFIVGSRDLPVDKVPVAVLSDLTAYESRHLVPHPESGGALMLPRYDIAGAAAGTLELREHRLAVSRMLSQMKTEGGAWFADAAAPKSAAEARAWLDAARSVSPDRLRTAADSLKSTDELDPAAAELAAVMAVRLADPVLAAQVVRKADSYVAGRILNSLDVFPAGEAMALVKEAARRPALTSGAVLAAAPLAGRDPRARSWLLAQLDRPERGASAATALARLDDSSIRDGIIRDIAAGMLDEGLRSRLLYLHLDGSAAADAALKRFVADPSVPAALREEMARWR